MDSTTISTSTGAAAPGVLGTSIRDRLSSICATACQLIGADQVALWAYDATPGDSERGVVSLVAASRWDSGQVELAADGRWSSIPISELPAFGQALSTSSVAIASGVGPGEPLAGRQAELLKELGGTGFDCEPVEFSGRAVGLLLVQPPRVLDTERAILLPAVMDEAGFLLSKAGVLRYREEAGFLLSLMGDAMSAPAGSLPLEGFCLALARRLRCDHAALLEAVGDERWHCVISASPTNAPSPWLDDDLSDPELASKLRRWSESLEPLQSSTGSTSIDLPDTATLLGVSVVREGLPAGVLLVVAPDHREFSAAESLLLRQAAGVAGVLDGWSRLGSPDANGMEARSATDEGHHWLLGTSATEERSSDDVVGAVCAAAVHLLGMEAVQPVGAALHGATGYAALPPVKSAMTTGHVYFNDDLAAGFEGEGKPVLRSCIALPVGVGRRPWYVIAGGFRETPHTWSKEEIHLARRLAVEGSLRLEMARLARVDRHQVAAISRKLLRDPLTGLPNSVLLMDRIEQAINRSRRDRSPLALVCVDLERLREVNRDLGEAAGDALLAQAAQRLSRSLRTSDVVARVGDDEFAVLLTTSVSPLGIQVVLDKVRSVLGLPFDVGGEIALVGCRTGLATWPDDAGEATDLLTAAFDALRSSASDSAGAPPAGPVWAPPTPPIASPPVSPAPGSSPEAAEVDSPYSPVAEMGVRARGGPTALPGRGLAPHQVAQELPRALENDELVLHYLPKVAVADGDVVSMEALVRWRHPQLGLLPPGAFLPAVTDSELGWKVTRWVLDHALDQCAQWLASTLNLAVTVNVSRYDVTVAPLIDTVHDVLSRTHLLGRHLTLEISEQAVLDEMVRGSAVFVILRSEGVRISVDDCGSGKVAPLYLAKMPVDEIKIDNGLLRVEHPADLDLVRDIVDLGHSFGIQITAEAVEDEGNSGVLGMGIDNIQGYRIAGPLLPENVPTWVANHRARTNNERHVLWTG